MKTTRRRNCLGSAMTEMGPAMLILLMCIFFPMLDIMGAAAAYGSCFYLNVLQSRQAGVVLASDATSPSGQVQKGVVDNWLANGVGKFVKTIEYPQTLVKYRDGVKDNATQITYKVVTVRTIVKCRPFLTIPWFVPTPGISAPMTFSIASESQLENPDYAQ